MERLELDAQQHSPFQKLSFFAKVKFDSYTINYGIERDLNRRRILLASPLYVAYIE